ncbi:MAG TPA: CHAT domain-containing protein, partial [Draconibacterium sp.]|nr:CHAT domain-containing protein [Draconibacterium sp.]
SFSTGNYHETIEICNNITDILDRKYGHSDINDLYLQIDLAEILLLRAQSEYRTIENKDSEKNFDLVLEDINSAIKQLERQKTFITSRDEVANLIENNRHIFEFAKEINLELYRKTQKKQYLKQLTELHESSIYSRIRARLNLNENELSLIPENIAKREKELKHKLNSFFDSNEDAAINIDSLTRASQDWSDFLKSLKQQYPKYYNLRYASILQDIGNIDQNIPKNTTLVRYLFIGQKLYAYVLNEKSENLHELNFSGENKTIELFKDFTTPENTICDAADKLYRELWKPFEGEVNTSNVIIFPDEELYNLAFELLTPEKINSIKELTTKSLIVKYNISYNYSLFLLKNNQKAFDFDQDFVAFAPGFTDNMKNNYQLSVSDSLNLDKAYLRLLPQPFTSQLVKQIGKEYNGQSFLNENASKQLFVHRAGEHKIIHIGTHAESNNTEPELSRLVFAKNLTDTTGSDDNYLYNYEIYNINLNSELAILTACETGKPAYQPGEGMISLAHAFNYAGSQSILTSLWEIDEKTSAEILTWFYKYLQKGKRKDEALRLAKLDYMRNADGRTINPQYWAGLILMGNTDPMQFSVYPASRIIWIAVILLLVISTFL